MFKKSSAILTVIVIMISMFLFLGTVNAVQKNFTSTINPTTTYVGKQDTFTVTIHDSPSNPPGNKLGSASIIIPTNGFNAVKDLAVTTYSSKGLPTGKNWTPSTITSSQIELTAATSSDCISPGDYIEAVFSAIATNSGAYNWLTKAYTQPGWSGDLFTLMSGTTQPKVTVIQEVSVTFAYKSSDKSFPTTNPTVTYYHFGDSTLTYATSDGISVWVDFGSLWSYSNPIFASTTEQWIAISASISGSVTGSITTIDPTYYHQFDVSASYSTYDGSTPSSDVVLSGTSLGSATQTALSTVPMQVWLNAGSAWSVNNPIPTSPTTEQWIATSGVSGTVSSTTNVSPLYYHQYWVTFATSPSARAGATFPSGSSWQNAGSVLQLSAIAYFGYTFSSWSTQSSILITPSSSSTATATFNGPGTVTAIFTANSGTAQVVPSTTEEEVYPDPNVGLDFISGTTGGVATADTSSPVPPPPGTTFFIGPVWDIKTNAGFTGNITVGIVVDLGSSGTDPSSLHIWQADFPLGDVNFDGTVNSNDTIIINKFYGTTPSSPNWNPLYDLNNDGIVNSLDVTICTHNYGLTTIWTMLPQASSPMNIPGTTLWVIYGSTDHFSGFGVH